MHCSINFRQVTQYSKVNDSAARLTAPRMPDRHQRATLLRVNKSRRRQTTFWVKMSGLGLKNRWQRKENAFHLMNEPASAQQPITHLLHAIEQGLPNAIDTIFTLLYDDLYRMARAKLRPHQHNPLVDATTVVHESYIRLARTDGIKLVDRRHFFAYASRVMRSVVVDLARSARAERRGGESLHVTLDTAVSAIATETQVLDVHEALQQLEQVAPRLVRVVEARYFVGLSELETASMLGITDRTVRRDMEKARLMIAEFLRTP
jgi:RNA polymerase sigma factor (TIGR02999 family)